MLWRIVAPDTISAQRCFSEDLTSISSRALPTPQHFQKKACCVPSCFWVLWPTLFFIFVHGVTASCAKEVVEKFMRNMQHAPSSLQVRARVIQAENTRELKDVLSSCERSVSERKGVRTMLNCLFSNCFC